MGSTAAMWLDLALSELQILRTKAHEMETKAFASIDDACAKATDQETIKFIMTARLHLVDPAQTPTLAVQSERANIMAMSRCSEGTILQALQEADRCIRDIIVLRVQMWVPLTSRPSFISAFTAAYGEELPRDAHAKLLCSHSKVISPLFPQAFLSESAERNARRG